jgi:hypothetical protein
MQKRLLTLGFLFLIFCFYSSSNADVPQMINYQGKITTPAGALIDTTVQMIFTIYDDSTSGNTLWVDTLSSVAVDKGIFSVLLGSGNPIPDSVFNGDVRYLGIKVGGDPEMTPRKVIASVAYALHSAFADSAPGGGSGGLVSVDGVSNPGGDVDFIQQNAITITPNDGANTITFGETHSGRTDNPHGVTAAQTGALVSTDGVSNAGGDVDFVQQNAITITPNDGTNTVTFGETHSGRTDNPHGVTAAQTGALVSVDGVSNAGGDVDFIAGANMTITPNDGANTITFSSSTGGYHHVFTVAQSGGDFTTISTALDSCVNPGPNNTYLIRVMPGTYPETFTCSSFVRLQGAGKYVSRIQGTVTTVDSSTIDGFWIEEGILCPGTSPTITHNIVNNDGVGIWITDGGTPWIKENEIIDCDGFGIHCDGWGTDAWIIANKIERNGGGGIQCTNSSPTISNNQILSNHNYGIYLIGIEDMPSEPTIDDNVIGRTDPDLGGIGIYMIGFAEPRIIANDIWVNNIGIQILEHTQPSILANNINYNRNMGIQCFSSGASKPPTIKGNHIHSNPNVGLDIVNAFVVVSHNNINLNDPAGVNPDIQYVGPPFPMISLNVVDIIVIAGSGATGLFNVTTAGGAIAP